MEFIKKLLLFSFKVLELLKSNFELPLNLLWSIIVTRDFDLILLQFGHDDIVFDLELSKTLNFCVCLSQGLNHTIILFLLIHFLSCFFSIFFFSLRQFIFQLLNDVKIGIGDFLIILLDVVILLGVFCCQLFNSCIFLLLD